MSVWSILRRVHGRGKALTRVRGGRRDTDTAIATVLVLRPSIVRNHMTSIYQTLVMRSHSELVELLYAHGLTAFNGSPPRLQRVSPLGVQV
jgi:DNA-binding CsgD family transcriptional regulator